MSDENEIIGKGFFLNLFKRLGQVGYETEPLLSAI